MTRLKLISILVLGILSVQSSLAQKTAGPIDLFSGAIQANGLPEGWSTPDENDCRIKFDENRAIFFERQSPDEKCSFVFTREMPDGIFTLKTRSKNEGNGKEILLDGKPLKKEQTIEVSNGTLNFGIQTKGGKAWGWIYSITVVYRKSPKPPKSTSLPVRTVRIAPINEPNNP